MTDTALQIRRNYQKEWREKNKERIKTYTKRYWEKKARRVEEIDAFVNQQEEGDAI